MFPISNAADLSDLTAYTPDVSRGADVDAQRGAVSLRRAADEKPGAPAQPEDERTPGVIVEISASGRELAQAEKPSSAKDSTGSQEKTGANGDQDAENQEAIRKLKARDLQVRAHEMAHLMAAGNLARGGMSFEYETGPDGKRYAVGGEVSIDASAEDDPTATLSKAARVKRAALAPADPSPQDRQVATAADALAAEAQRELAKEETATSGQPAQSSAGKGAATSKSTAHAAYRGSEAATAAVKTNQGKQDQKQVNLFI